MRTITFLPTWDAWRRCAVQALRQGVAPGEIFWVPEEHDAQSTLPLTGDYSSPRVSREPRCATAIPASGAFSSDFERFAKPAAHHRNDDRFALLYRLLWRAHHGEAELLGDMLDPDVFRLRRMAAAVREDLKDTRSQLQLRDPAFQARSAAISPAALPDLVGWCEPDHRVLPLLAEELATRHPTRSFALLSPQATAFWDGRQLDLGPGADRAGFHSAHELAMRWETRRQTAA